MRLVVVLPILVFVLATQALADNASGESDRRILVTFADPGLGRKARIGPLRPGYSRGAANYLVSLDVQRAANKLAEEFELLKVDEWPIVALKVHCLVFEFGEDIVLDELLAEISVRPDVESVQALNYFDVRGAHEATSNDPYSHLQRNHDSLDIRRAHTWSTGDGVDVTIIDTGADFRHPDLKAQIKDRQDFVGFRGGTFDQDAHGTAIAGIIAAEPDNGVGIVGIAPAVRLRVLKACWYDASATAAVCDSFTLAKALAHAIDEDTNIINLSLGGPSDALLSRLVSAALARNILVVVADPVQSLAGFPSDVPGVIVAGSVAQPDADRLGAILGAPGDEILVPVPGGGFDYASGSSLSAAQVSGVAALLMAKRPGLHRDEIHDLLAGSRNALDANVNACRALSSLLDQLGCSPGESGVSNAFRK